MATKRYDAARRIDSNQREIVEALKAAGCAVVSTARMGGGFPDLVVGRGDIGHGQIFLLEVKGPKGRFTPSELRFAASWHGNYRVVRSVEEALRAVGLMEVADTTAEYAASDAELDALGLD